MSPPSACTRPRSSSRAGVIVDSSMGPPPRQGSCEHSTVPGTDGGKGLESAECDRPEAGHWLTGRSSFAAMLHPLDEFPVHQTPLSMSQVGTSDKNFYDRCYFNAHDRTGDVFVITGLGTYANLGVVDAYATVKVGDTVRTARFSDALGTDRMHQQVGPYRIEVLEPLQRVRVVCDGDDHGVGFDLTWEGSFPAVEEEPHVINNGFRTILQSTRFAQLGTWTGEVRVDGDDDRGRAVDLARQPRPVVGHPPGRRRRRARAAPPTTTGAGGLLVAVRAAALRGVLDHRDGPGAARRLPHPQRRQAGVGRRPGRAARLAGLRHPLPLGHAPPRAARRCGMHDMRGKPVTVEIETLGFVPLHLGPGYGDADWAHGQWKGAGWAESVVVDLDRPGDRAAHPVRQHRPRRARGRATAPRASACSSTPASARTRRPASPTSWRSRRERRRAVSRSADGVALVELDDPDRYNALDHRDGRRAARGVRRPARRPHGARGRRRRARAGASAPAPT